MKLTYVSISNYRSITTAHKIDLSNLTVLLGKNNEGKTNVLSAIDLGMEILSIMNILQHRSRIPKQLYDWYEDFPLALQAKKLKEKNTSIRMDFMMNDDETAELFNKIHSNINGTLSIYIEIGEGNSFSITIPKQGKNARALTNNLLPISQLICKKFDVVFIPAIRLETDAYSIISDFVNSELSSIDDQRYIDSLKYIEKIQQESLDSLAKRVKIPLEKFLPKIKSISLYMTDHSKSNNYFASKMLNMDINDGVLTSLSNKGDGVKSLVTIAMLSQISTKKDRLIIIDEPETHLHPDAVRYICSVLNEMAKENQVLISTHNPIFVNRNNISSNWIVEGGETRKADRIDTIRQTLGVICSDNLMYSDYVIVVEGLTDRTLLDKVFQEDEVIRNCIANKVITIRPIGGINNLRSEVYALQRYCCNYLVILDYDGAGRKAANDLIQTLSVPTDKIRYFMKSKTEEFELEDLYEPSIYKDYLLRNGIDISNGLFKNKSIKWSTRLENINAMVGKVLASDEKDTYKKEIVNMIDVPVKNYVTEQGYKLLMSICSNVKDDLKGMSLL